MRDHIFFYLNGAPQRISGEAIFETLSRYVRNHLRATGTKIAAYPKPVQYEGYQREGMRHAWTTEPDESGRYHALTLRRQEIDEEAWEVTADQPFPTVDEARDWAARLFAETE